MQLSKEQLIWVTIAVTIAVFIVLLFFFIVLLLNVRLRNRKKIELLKAVIGTEERERNRIASDLHDEINPSLSNLKHRISKLDISSTEPGNRQQIESIPEELESVIQKVRVISRSLSSSIVESKGLFAAFNEFGNMISKAGSIRCYFIHEGIEDDFSLESASTIYRIVQELMNNSIRHANCSEISIDISSDGQTLTMNYRDNGQSDRPVQEGMGLRNIRTRTASLRGTLISKPDFSDGAEYTFIFPLSNLYA